MDIIRHKKYFLIIALVIVVSALAIVFTLGLKPSIDFTGGSLTEVRYSEMPEKAQIEAAVTALDFGELSVRQSTARVLPDSRRQARRGSRIR